MIEKALGAAAVAFDKREAIELRELQFGLFDGIADEDLPRLFPREYEHYEKHKHFEGEFFAPMRQRRSLGLAHRLYWKQERLFKLVLAGHRRVAHLIREGYPC